MYITTVKKSNKNYSVQIKHYSLLGEDKGHINLNIWAAKGDGIKINTKEQPFFDVNNIQWITYEDDLFIYNYDAINKTIAIKLKYTNQSHCYETSKIKQVLKRARQSKVYKVYFK